MSEDTQDIQVNIKVRRSEAWVALQQAARETSPTANKDAQSETIYHYAFPPRQSIHVGAETWVRAADLPICQICRHLNPDFTPSENHTTFGIPWVPIAFQPQKQIRSCAFDIDNGQALAISARRGCTYCDVISTALSRMRPGWEAEESLLRLRLGWGLPIAVKLDYGRVVPKSEYRTFFGRDTLFDGKSDGPDRVVIAEAMTCQDAEQIEIYRSDARDEDDKLSASFPHLGLAPQRPMRADDEASFAASCRNGEEGHEKCIAQ